MKRFAIGILMILAASMIMASTAAKDLYVPAASRATGAFATDWKSDVRAFNPGTTAATVNITYLPMAQWASQYATIQVLIDPGETLVMENILQEDFGLTPNTAGALHFVSNVDIYVESRVYTPNKNGAPGTFGQRIPGVPANQAVAATESVDVLYVDNIASETTGFRTNFGLVAVEGAVNYTLAAFNQNGDPIGTPFNGSVAANQWDQYNALGKLGVTADTQYARVKFTVTSGKAIPYASQADNASGDAVYIDGTKIKSSGGGGGNCVSDGIYLGYNMNQAEDLFGLLNGTTWLDIRGNKLYGFMQFWWVYVGTKYYWTVDNFSADPENGNYYFDTPIDLAQEASFSRDFVIIAKSSAGKECLKYTITLAGEFDGCSYLNGTMDVMATFLGSCDSTDWKDGQGKFKWNWETGIYQSAPASLKPGMHRRINEHKITPR